MIKLVLIFHWFSLKLLKFWCIICNENEKYIECNYEVAVSISCFLSNCNVDAIICNEKLNIIINVIFLLNLHSNCYYDTIIWFKNIYIYIKYNYSFHVKTFTQIAILIL